MSKIIETGVSRVALAIGGSAADAVPVDATNPLPVSFGTGGVTALQEGNSTDARAASATANKQSVVSYQYVFNGTTWDRQRGDTAGIDVIQGVRSTAGGVTQFRRIATADTNLAAVKASAGRVYGYVIANSSASAKYVKLYNKATAPVLATDVPLRTIMIPAGGIAAYHVGMGLGGFALGIAVSATGAMADTDATALAAGDLVIQIDYA